MSDTASLDCLIRHVTAMKDPGGLMGADRASQIGHRLLDRIGYDASAALYPWPEEIMVCSVQDGGK